MRETQMVGYLSVIAGVTIVFALLGSWGQSYFAANDRYRAFCKTDQPKIWRGQELYDSTPGSRNERFATSHIFVRFISEGNFQSVQLTGLPNQDDRDPNWSPDGSTIVFTRAQVRDISMGGLGPRHLWVMNKDSSNPRQLTFETQADVFSPAFAPDGSAIVYMEGNTLWSIKPDGTESHKLDDTKQLMLHHQISSDSQHVTYTIQNRVSGSSDIHVVSLEDRTSRIVFSDLERGYHSSFTSESWQLVIKKGMGGSNIGPVYLVNINTGMTEDIAQYCT